MIAYMLLAAVNGGIVTGSRLINAGLGAALGSVQGAWINHIVGTLFAALLLGVGMGTGHVHLQGIPLAYLLGGVLGVFLVTFNNYAMPLLGSAAVAILMLCAQLLTSSVIDHSGLLGGQVYPVTPLKAAGLGLLMLGAGLVITGKGRGKAVR